MDEIRITKEEVVAGHSAMRVCGLPRPVAATMLTLNFASPIPCQLSITADERPAGLVVPEMEGHTECETDRLRQKNASLSNK